VSDWLDALRALPPLGRDATAAAVIVSVVATRGSAPRPAGTHMVVTRERVDGTIGGGHLEFRAIAIARDLVAGNDHAERLRRFPLGASLGQCCGGVVTLLFEPVAGDMAWIARTAALRGAGVPCVTIAPTGGDAATGRLVVTAADVFGGAAADASVIEHARELLRAGAIASLVRMADDANARGVFFDPVLPVDFAIVLFGAGHVGKALVRMLAELDCRITWIDTRIDAFPDTIPANVVTISTDAPEDEVDAARPGSYFLVMTHEHALDERLTERILRRDDFAYFGLIGSLSKRRQFEQRLSRRGMPTARFEAMTCPIGIAGIRGKAPATIAVAVAAQVLQMRDARASARTPSEATAAIANARSTSVKAIQ